MPNVVASMVIRSWKPKVSEKGLMLGGLKMSKAIMIISAVMVMLMVTPSYAAAEAVASFSQDVEFDAIDGADETQNAFDPNAKTNADTWDVAPQGVWFGGYPLESLGRVDEVPDTNFQVAYTTVCRFGSDIIMSGASRTLVRLPLYTGVDPWTTARLNVYKIDPGSNWTFVKDVATQYFAGYDLNDMKISFTSGTHELVFWSDGYSPLDASPTDDDDHFTRANRTYVFVDAPIQPNQFYLFVTYAWYASDRYVDFYAQPDSLDTLGIWNRSDLAYYNELAPDTFNLEVHNFNTSLGYSFDFQNGFGNSAYGLNIWCEPGDQIEFFSYVNLSNVRGADYLTLMIPFRSSLDNVSFDVLIQVIDQTGAPPLWSHVDLVDWDDYICRDFILLSMTSNWSTNKTALGFEPMPWFKIILDINNQTRLWLPLWDEPGPSGDMAKVNDTWNHQWFEPIYDSDTEYNYNLEQWVQHERGTETYNYHWAPQHALQFNNYYWAKNTPQLEGVDNPDPVDDMTFAQKIIFAVGKFWFKVGDVVVAAGIPYGANIRNVALGVMFVARYGEFPDLAGRVLDGLAWFKAQFGNFVDWLWRAAQAVWGAFEYFIDLVKVLVGIVILILAFATLYIPTSLTLKGAMAFRKFMLGDIEGAAAHLNAAGSQIGGYAKMAKKIRPGGR